MGYDPAPMRAPPTPPVDPRAETAPVRGQGDPARGVAVLEEAVEVHAVLVKDQPARFTDEHGAFTEVLADARHHLALLRDEVAPASPEEAITQATLFVTAGDHAGGVRAYRVALASEAMRADLAGRALFHAACCAAFAAAAEPDPAKRDGFADEAIAWLADDLRRRREQLAEAERGPPRRRREVRSPGSAPLDPGSARSRRPLRGHARSERTRGVPGFAVRSSS